MLTTKVLWRGISRRGFRPRISPRTPPGTAPGTIISDPEAHPSSIRVVAYSEAEVVEQALDRPEQIREYLDKWPVVWVNVDGLGGGETIAAIGELFGLHPLALEDVANANQRPKVEEYPGSVFIVIRMPTIEDGAFRTEQLSIFLGQNYILTFQERPGDCFEPVRRRIRESARTRFLDASYLAYALLDAVVDSFFPVLETVSESLDAMEEQIAKEARSDVMSGIFQAKHELLSLRRAIWPMRDSLNVLIRDPVDLISDSTRTYLRDCHDHAVRIVDLVETYRELNTGLMELYQSAVGQRMNEIMKVLTIIATIFIPLTFIAGVYGMNFNAEASPLNMPELSWYFGYPLALAVMVGIAFGLVLYFRRRGWLG